MVPNNYIKCKKTFFLRNGNILYYKERNYLIKNSEGETIRIECEEGSVYDDFLFYKENKNAFYIRNWFYTTQDFRKQKLLKLNG